MSALLQDYAARRAETHASDVALVMDDARMTYGDLEAESNRLARLLMEAGCRPGDRVCLFTAKSPAAIVAMHASLKAGAAYVPIDPASPAPRIAKIVDAADPRLVLAASGAASVLDEMVAAGELRVPIGSLDAHAVAGEHFTAAFAPDDWRRLASEPTERRGASDSMAHILFTSGSTGTPKGVVITHANVVSFIEWAVPHFGIRPADRVSGHPPLHFDLSTFDIYGAFAAGAELHLVPPELGVDPHRLAALIRDAELTQWFSVPSVLTYMAKFDAVSHNDFPTLVRLMWCGEVLPTPILVHWMTRLPHVRFTNLYGPTEATIASSHHTVRECPTDPAQPIPIGVACANEELLVLDDERRAVPQGEIGEIFIAGAGLSPGYWRDEEKTRVAFLPDPRPGHEGGRIYRTGDLGRVDDDGRIEFLGRVDSQIKSRGYRIELGEIEAALSAIVEVRECAVVGVDTGEFGGTEICSAYASVAGRTVERAYLRGELSKVLPSYMLPTHWRRFDRLPKNVNGKIDRRGLRELFEQGADGQAATRPVARAEGLGV
jgi:amino acid adenylation domain-containing protein